MSRWFRHYAGMMRDPKFAMVSIRTKQPVERVLFVWCCALESAAEINDCGRFDVSTEEIAYFLHCKPQQIQTVKSELETIGLFSDGIISKWSSRQFESDTSASRMRKLRAKNGHGDVTETSR